MKKILIVIFTFLMSMSAQAYECIKISFVCQGLHGWTLGHNHPKSPAQPPTVYIEGYTLTFSIDHPAYVLTIKDEDGEVVHSTEVYSAQTQVMLPSSLSGSYEIELATDNWLFTGWITL